MGRRGSNRRCDSGREAECHETGNEVIGEITNQVTTTVRIMNGVSRPTQEAVALGTGPSSRVFAVCVVQMAAPTRTKKICGQTASNGMYAFSMTTGAVNQMLQRMTMPNRPLISIGFARQSSVLPVDMSNSPSLGARVVDIHLANGHANAIRHHCADRR